MFEAHIARHTAPARRGASAPLCHAVLHTLQMNALHEPWDDGAASDDMSWGAPQQLAAAAAADTEAESAVSRAADAYNAVLASTTDPAALQAAQAAYEAQRKALPLGSGLFHGPPKPISLPPNHRNPPVSDPPFRGSAALVGSMLAGVRAFVRVCACGLCSILAAVCTLLLLLCAKRQQ